MSMTTTARFTRADYARLPEGFPAYLLDGDFVKEEAPTWGHQGIAHRIAVTLDPIARDRVLSSPVDVVIDDWNVLQPDVMVLREGARWQDVDREEVPVLVAEVLSPSTESRDRGAKAIAYLRAGVAEIWLVDPDAGAIDVVTSDGTRHHDADDEAVSTAVPGFHLRGADLIR